MKILIYADPHFSSKSSIIRGRGKKYSVRLENLIETFKWINKLAVEKGCEEIICLGDLFDSPDLTAEEITAIAECDIGHHKFIVGNHDALSNDLSLNAINTFQNSTIYTEPTMIELGGKKIIILPYITEIDRIPLKELLAPYQNENYIVLSHNDIKGVQYGAYVSKTGYDYKEIPDNCELFINGHIHNGGFVGEDRVLNLGSLTGMNFNNDATNWKPCVAILDLDNSSIDFIPNPYAFLFYKRDYSDSNISIIKEFLDSLDSTMKNVISIKVNSELVDQVQELIKNRNHIYYSRVLADYSGQQVEYETKNISIDVNIDYFEKFKEFVLLKYGEDTTVNCDLLLTEIEQLRT